jgi:hypothetical protein
MRLPLLLSLDKFMSLKSPTHLNLEFFKNPKQLISDESALLCHVEHDDYGNKLRAIPLKFNANGHIILDFKNVVAIDVD